MLENWAPQAVVTDCAVCGASGMDLARQVRDAVPGTRLLMLATDPPEGAEGVYDAVVRKGSGVRQLSDALCRLGVEPRQERDLTGYRLPLASGVRPASRER